MKTWGRWGTAEKSGKRISPKGRGINGKFRSSLRKLWQ
ncbi:hypothetical protein HPSMNH_1446 [Glaesserella parasuis MN-H]|nr:hypothetical protein HPSMNH_1446 [Glaesserella parasuis MN-H]